MLPNLGDKMLYVDRLDENGQPVYFPAVVVRVYDGIMTQATVFSANDGMHFGELFQCDCVAQEAGTGIVDRLEFPPAP